LRAIRILVGCGCLFVLSLSLFQSQLTDLDATHKCDLAESSQWVGGRRWERDASELALYGEETQECWRGDLVANSAAKGSSGSVATAT
jgi:hypothetical protein